MEAAGLVVDIVTLYTACQSCFYIYSNTKDATESAIQAARELEIQKSILKSWAFYWGISKSLGAAENSIEKENSKLGKDIQISAKLEQYLRRYPDKFIGIVSALCRIADALSSKEELLKRYGLDVNLWGVKPLFTLTELDPVLSPRAWGQVKEYLSQMRNVIRLRLPPMQKIVWALNDVKKFRSLIDTLKRHNDSLHLLGPEWASQFLGISLALEFLPRHGASDLKQMRRSSSRIKPLSIGDESSAGLNSHLGTDSTSTSSQQSNEEDAAGEETGSLLSPSPSQQGLQVLADLADIKIEASAMRNDEALSLEEEKLLFCFESTDLEIGKIELRQTCSHMAFLLSRGETVYLQEHSYEADTEELSRKIRTSILKLGRLLKLPACSKRLHVLKLLGLVDLSHKTIGFVYELPSSLGKPRKGFPMEDMGIRQPRCALMIGQGDPPGALGRRFELARKLVQSVALLHACGWLHRNIRKEELVFFPKSGSALSQDPEFMDFENPFLLGYHYSRPDEFCDQLRKESEEAQARNVENAALQAPATEVPSNQNNPVPKAPTVRTFRRRRPNSYSNSNASSYSSRSPRPNVPVFRSPRTIKLEVRHHPSKRAYPNRRFCHAFDVYSLGIVLLELGLWRDIENILLDHEDKRDFMELYLDPFELRRFIVRIAQKKLPFACGEVYTNVTVSCLNVDAEDSVDNGLLEQRNLCARIAADLAQCQA